MMLYAKELPLVLRAIAQDTGRKAASQRHFDVRGVTRGQVIRGASIEGTLGAMPADTVPSDQGGGWRTRSPVFIARDGGGGKYWFGVAPAPGKSWDKFTDVAQLAAACDYWLEVIEGEAAGRREELDMGEKLRRGARAEEAEYDLPQPAIAGDLVTNRETGDAGRVLRSTDERLLALIHAGPNQGQELQVGSHGELYRAWVRESSGGHLGATPPDMVRILMETVELNGERETVGEFSLESMIAENAGDERLVEGLIDLRVGQRLEVGGGGAPRIWLTRLSDSPHYVGNALQGD